MEKFYYLNNENHVKGPVSLNELQSLVKLKAINENAQVCKEGEENWIPLIEIIQSDNIKNKLKKTDLFNPIIQYFIDLFKKSSAIGMTKLQANIIILLLILISLFLLIKPLNKIAFSEYIVSKNSEKGSNNLILDSTPQPTPATTSDKSPTIDSKTTIDPTLDLPKALVKNKKEELIFEEVATPALVEIALEEAQKDPTIENWRNVSVLANALAKSIDVIGDHFSNVDGRLSNIYKSGSSPYLEKAVKLEEMSNNYKEIRNDAYLEMAKKYLNNGQKVQALNISARSVDLSGGIHNSTGVDFISQLIEIQIEDKVK